jgi:eukaryotic-like serine/threonine-protein kinase
MQKSPADRYQSAGEMRTDIQRALSGAPLAAPMPGNGYGPGTRRMGATATQLAGRTAAIPPYRYGPEDGGPDGPPQRQRRAWPWVALATVVAVLIAAIVLLKFVTGGSGGVAVPNVINQTLAVAEHNITSAGLRVGTITPQQSATVAKNLVISTNPAFGSSEPRGSAVNIVYSTGPKPVAKKLVPDVTGLKISKAVAELKAAGFQVNQVSGQSTTAPPNTVISYSPQGNQPVGSLITITVSGSTVTVPADVICKPAQAAITELSGAPYNFVVAPAQQGPGNGTCPAGTVYQTSPATGTTVQPGSPITIFVVQASQSPTPTVTPTATPTVTPSSTHP